MDNPVIETYVEPPGFVLQHSRADADIGRAKNLEAAAGMTRIRIRRCRDDLANARRYEGVRAGRRPSVRATWLQADEKSRAAW
jgi:hypothetical protein